MGEQAMSDSTAFEDATPYDGSRQEVEEAFQRYWTTGPVDEDWEGWVNLFVPDLSYRDHFWGTMHGREEIQLWIDAVMKGVPEIYTVLDWYTIDGGTVVFHCQNRRDNPDSEGPDYWDFPGLSVLRYAGDGMWASEEDFWDAGGARKTSTEYYAACRRAGADDPDQRMTRKFWPTDGPAWARTDKAPSPSWLGKDVPAITKPREFAELIGRDPR
jgi:hypothetical protein